MTRVRTVFLAVSVTIVLLFAGLLAASRQAQEDLFRALGTLAEVMHLVHTEYVEELNQEALALSLEAGIVEASDPDAAVLPTEQVKAYTELLEEPPPYGLMLTRRLQSAALRHTVAGSPAAQAGLEDWEVVEELQGINTRGRPLWQVRLELRQRERQGQPTTLTVMSRRVDERREVTLPAEPWQPQIFSSAVHDGVRVLTLLSLPAGAVETIRLELAANPPAILDLRDLVWGSEDEALAAADLLVAEGTLGAWRGRKAGSKVFTATSDRVATMPLVLVGPQTEGSGEVFAAALQRAGARLIGSTTAGHASHMRLIQDGGINLLLPVAYWLRPDDTPIHSAGVEPDEAVDAAAAGEDDDPVLDRAFQLLSEAHAAAA